MEASPPSYREATSVKPWSYIARFLRAQDLCSVVRTCKEWNEGFAPALWGSPMAHFAGRDKSVYSSLNVFRRTLLIVRPSIRALVHTLDLPRASADYDYSPRPEWLRDIVRYLPKLQSLIISGLPFFDHASILSLAQSISNLQNSEYNTSLGANLRLLRVRSCKNATPASLAAMLNTVPMVVYLDLSYTIASRDQSVLWKLSYLQFLKILNLQGVALKDEDLNIVASNLGHRVQCLDLRGNRLTSASTDFLLKMILDNATNPSSIPSYQSSTIGEDAFQKILRSEDLEDQLYERLTSSPASHLILEDINEKGLTHLRIANNAFSISAVALLLRKNRLHVLDAGDLAESQFPLNGLRDSTGVVAPDMFLSSLTYLRCHHTLVTGASRESKSALIYPVKMHRVRRLVLTGIPPKAPDEEISRRIIAFIRDCSREQQIALLQSRLDYTLPPGRLERPSAWAAQAHSIFALREITLELAPAKTAHTLFRMKAEGWNYHGTSRSVTEDADSESLWRSAESDFSFFGSEDPKALDDHNTKLEAEASLYDVVAAIAKFRQSCKTQYESARRRGETFPKVEGYWDGQIKIVRSSFH